MFVTLDTTQIFLVWEPPALMFKLAHFAETEELLILVLLLTGKTEPRARVQLVTPKLVYFATEDSPTTVQLDIIKPEQHVPELHERTPKLVSCVMVESPMIVLVVTIVRVHNVVVLARPIHKVV